ARRDGTNADFGDEFDGNARLRIDVLEVVDELREIFDGVDVVMRRWGNEADAGRGMAEASDDFVDFVAGKLATFAGLSPLGHFDLQFVGVDEVVGGDSEPSGGDLLDGAAAEIAIRIWLEARLVFPALSGVGAASDAVHGNGESFVGFLTDGAEGHGAGGEALDDFFRGLDFVERDWFRGGFDLEQAAKSAELAVLIID